MYVCVNMVNYITDPLEEHALAEPDGFNWSKSTSTLKLYIYSSVPFMYDAKSNIIIINRRLFGRRRLPDWADS